MSDTMASRGAEPLVRNFCARRGGLFIALLFIIIGALFAWQASLLPLGTLGLPGAGLFPLVLAILLMAFCAVIAASLMLAKPSAEPVELGHRDVVVAIAAMVAVPALFEGLGTYLTLGLFTVALLMIIGRVPPTRAVPAAAAGMAGVWFVFKNLLGLQLPNGTLF